MTDAPTQDALVCPKCRGAMRSYERSGITIDQCSDCRGVFLDRGELERLVEAEDVHYTSGEQGRGPAYSGESGRSGHGGGHHGGGSGRGRKRGGFLGDLFD